MNKILNPAGRINRTTLFLFGVAGFIFILFLILISYNIRLCSDDFYFLNDFIEKGWFRSVAENKYNIRWSGFLLFNTIFLFNSDFQSIQINLFVYYFITILFLIVSSFNFLRIFFLNFTNNKFSKYSVLLLSVIFIITIYFSTSSVIEVWFWTINSTSYLYSVIFLILGISEVFSHSRTFFSYIIIFLSFLFIGNALENFALCTLFLLLALLFMKGKISGNNFNSRHLLRKIIIAVIPLLSSIILSFASGGIERRYDLESSVSGSGFYIDVERITGMFFQYKNAVFIFFLVVFFIAGKIFSENGMVIQKINVIKFIIWNVLTLLIVILLTFIPLFIVFKSQGPERAWLPFNLFLCVSLVFWSFYSGYSLKKRILSFIKYSVSVIGILIIICYSVRQTEYAFNFSVAYDQRTETIIKLRNSNNKATVFLKPLPDPGVIASQELDANNGKTNYGLKKLLKLNFDLKSEK